MIIQARQALKDNQSESRIRIYYDFNIQKNVKSIVDVNQSQKQHHVSQAF